MADKSQTGADGSEFRTGLLCALGAYGMWGFLPAYYKLTESVPADLVVAHRIIWSVLLLTIILVVRRRFDEFIAILKEPKLVGLLAVSACLIAFNWLIFIWAIEQGKVLDVALGYFCNPLVNVVVGLVVLREKLTRAQSVAVGLAVLGVGVQAVLAGGLPWVSLALAFSFAGYGYVRKVTPVRPTPGLLVETVLLLPLSIGYVLLNLSWGVDALSLGQPAVLAALVGTGVVTSVPLILFSAGARRLPMVMLGLMQYIAPSLHFIMAVFVWNEPLMPTTLMTFVIVWIALAIFTGDSLLRWKRSPKRAAA